MALDGRVALRAPVNILDRDGGVRLAFDHVGLATRFRALHRIIFPQPGQYARPGSGNRPQKSHALAPGRCVGGSVSGSGLVITRLKGGAGGGLFGLRGL